MPRRSHATSGTGCGEISCCPGNPAAAFGLHRRPGRTASGMQAASYNVRVPQHTRQTGSISVQSKIAADAIDHVVNRLRINLEIIAPSVVPD